MQAKYFTSFKNKRWQLITDPLYVRCSENSLYFYLYTRNEQFSFSVSGQEFPHGRMANPRQTQHAFLAAAKEFSEKLQVPAFLFFPKVIVFSPIEVSVAQQQIWRRTLRELGLFQLRFQTYQQLLNIVFPTISTQRSIELYSTCAVISYSIQGESWQQRCLATTSEIRAYLHELIQDELQTAVWVMNADNQRTEKSDLYRWFLSDKKMKCFSNEDVEKMITQYHQHSLL